MIIAIVGPTGVGKTFVSETLSESLDAEVINCDATQVYRDLNIGSAKPRKDEISNKKHHLFDIVDINENYNAYLFQKDLREILDNKKDKNFIIVGGTGLYLKAGLYNYTFSQENKERAKLKDEENDLLYDVIFIGLKTNRDNLYERINKRVDVMVKDGLLEEVKSLHKYKDTSRILNTAIGYKEIFKYIEGELTQEEALDLVRKNSRKYAKRQFTWFNNKMNIKWFDVDFDNITNTINEIENYIKTEIN